MLSRKNTPILATGLLALVAIAITPTSTVLAVSLGVVVAGLVYAFEVARRNAIVTIANRVANRAISHYLKTVTREELAQDIARSRGGKPVAWLFPTRGVKPSAPRTGRGDDC